MATREGPSRKGIEGLAGLLGGVSDLVDKLNALAEKGGVSRTGEFGIGKTSDSEKPIKGVYGVSFKVGGLKGDEVEVKPFGNVHRDHETGESVMEDVREPLTDVFDEGDHLLVVAEMPGVDAEDVRVSAQGRTLTLAAEHGERKYRKEIEIPEGLQAEDAAVTCKNGIIEVNCKKG